MSRLPRFVLVAIAIILFFIFYLLMLPIAVGILVVIASILQMEVYANKSPFDTLLAMTCFGVIVPAWCAAEAVYDGWMRKKKSRATPVKPKPFPQPASQRPPQKVALQVAPLWEPVRPVTQPPPKPLQSVKEPVPALTPLVLTFPKVITAVPITASVQPAHQPIHRDPPTPTKQQIVKPAAAKKRMVTIVGAAGQGFDEWEYDENVYASQIVQDLRKEYSGIIGIKHVVLTCEVSANPTIVNEYQIKKLPSDTVFWSIEEPGAPKWGL